MDEPWTEWSHLLKVDPDKSLPEGVAYGDLDATGTDAIVIGGTTGVTEENVTAVVDACSDLDVSLFQEPSNPDAVVDHPALDGYLVPIVMNAGDPFWITGAHMFWLASGGAIDWSITTSEAYIVLNPAASVATYTEADCDLTPQEVGAYATVAEELFGQEIVYIEYSGTLGDLEVLKAVDESISTATIFYGGGVRTYDDARTMAAYADVIVVGDLLHDAGIDAVTATVDGAKDA